MDLEENDFSNMKDSRMKFEVGFTRPMIISLLVWMFCCPVFGGVAFIYAIQAQVSAFANNRELSSDNLRKSKRCVKFGIILGVFWFLLLCLSLFIYIRTIEHRFASVSENANSFRANGNFFQAPNKNANLFQTLDRN
ncbi:hypothetical protein HELRODRAFT_159156 [Helobdella robusta]|uniref:Interferon-induced transmembrane protein n=1 Tax=Helobdella robusta TaxID=6412 RepID=T1ENP0_HELRO|nr:hypothetical protein HELRODRAFT_159156 [Helobdella robusta]ESO12595.1 hypothetical protein HELRODRAFT_159156 [Helobdella robusta]